MRTRTLRTRKGYMEKKLRNWVLGETSAERRIGATAAIILVLITLIAGAAVFATLSNLFDARLKNGLVGMMNDKESFFLNEIEAGVETAQGALERRPRLLALMLAVNAGAAGADDVHEIGAILGNIAHSRNVSAIELVDAHGKPVGGSGRFVTEPLVSAELRRPERAVLLWKERYVLQVAVPLRESETIIGTLRMEFPLPEMSRVLQDHARLGETGEIVICGALSQQAMRCFPSRLRPEGGEVQRRPGGVPLPMSKALDGESGAGVSLDYRRQEVFAAYRQLGDTGLGMLIKMDTRELKQPVRERLLWIAPVIAALVLLGVGLLRLQLGPLVHEVVSARTRMQAILDNTADGLITIDERGMVESFNISAARIFGYTAFEVIGKNVNMLMPESYRSKHDEGMQNYLRSGVAKTIGHGAREMQGLRKDGSVFPLEIALGEMTLDGRRLFIGSVRDTSALNQAHEDLKSGFVKLQAANRELEDAQAHLGQAEADKERQMLALAQANVRMIFLHDSMERLGHFTATLAVDGEEYGRSILAEAMTLTGAKYGAFGLFDKDGGMRKFLTDGVSAEEQQKIGAYPTGKGLLQAFYKEGKIARVDCIADDPRACGFPPGHPPMRSLLGVPLLVNGATRGVIYLADKHDGEPFSEHDEMMMDMLAVEVSHVLERNDFMASLSESNQTLTEEREEQRRLIARLEEAQNQLLQSEKMASIGQLAAGVAHEINNPIGYVYSNLGSLDKYIQAILGLVAAYEQAESAIASGEALSRVQAAKHEADLEFLREDVAALMNESREGITRVKKIVQDLKDFSHVDEAEWQWADIRQGLDSTLNIVWNEIKYKAEVVKEYGEMPEVECLPSQLNQVFMNLLVNAAHAIEERGTITLRTGVEGEEAWVEIADTGKGIPPENLSRIFDPFFTTKPVGKGTGLGLSLSYSIIQKHHGRIEVASEAGKGTTFRIWLPIRQPEKKA